jgi:hypothetical protein
MTMTTPLGFLISFAIQAIYSAKLVAGYNAIGGVNNITDT